MLEYHHAGFLEQVNLWNSNVITTHQNFVIWILEFTKKYLQIIVVSQKHTYKLR